MNRRNSTVRINSKSVPSAGMRGGLGRTLLTAFLLLSIVPLSLVSFVAATQARHNTQRELEEKLLTIAAVAQSQIDAWLLEQQHMLASVADEIAASQASAESSLTDAGSKSPSLNAESSRDPPQLLSDALLATNRDHQSHNATVLGWVLTDSLGQVVGSEPLITGHDRYPELSNVASRLLVSDEKLVTALIPRDRIASQTAVMAISRAVAETDLILTGLFDIERLVPAADAPAFADGNGGIYLQLVDGPTLKLNAPSADTDSSRLSEGAIRDSTGQQVGMSSFFRGQWGVRTFSDASGVMVIGAYRWLSDPAMLLLVEQAKDRAFLPSDDLAVVLIGATLAAVLLSALIAAAVTRRITLPIVELTATAVQIASGDLNQKVPATRRDEIGILARAFNVMTTKLRILYEDLELKVKERTEQLQEATAQIRYRATQLAISAEVARVVTSILDRDLLLPQVVELIRDCFQAYFVAIFFLDEGGKWVELQAGTGGLGNQLMSDGYRLPLGEKNLVSLALDSAVPCARRGRCLGPLIDRDLFPHTMAELVVPLRIGTRTFGVLDAHSTEGDAFDEDEIIVLETLARQVSVAIENARAYEMEREAAEQLRDVERLRRRFLANMSRELRMPLNNIIGFSRVMLKGIDGDITDLQREDLTAIHESGQQLLLLINDILDIAHIEAGAMELAIRAVDFEEIARSVVPTVNALLKGRPIEFVCEIDQDLPHVRADAQRLRQVLVKLLSNAAKFTRAGQITLRIWTTDDSVVTSVIDTGIGISEKDRDKVFEMFRQVSQPEQTNGGGTGLGLTFSKEIVELHGGSIWLESKVGKGTAFTFTLPKWSPAETTERRGG
jgi:signal transduction histidine kinase